MKNAEKRVIEDALQMGSGYVLNFNDRTFREWFDDEGIDIYGGAYDFAGSSKANHMRAFLQLEDEATVARILRAIWSYAESLPRAEDRAHLKDKFFDIVIRLEGSQDLPRTDAFERFKKDETLDELVAAIERDVSADKPAAALDRLHLYCMKKFAHLLDQRGLAWTREEPLHSRVGRYVRSLEQERELRKVTLRILKASISIFDDLNDVRNNKSFAHDNNFVDKAEARFIFDAVSTILRFVKSVDTARFGV